MEILPDKSEQGGKKDWKDHRVGNQNGMEIGWACTTCAKRHKKRYIRIMKVEGGLDDLQIPSSIWLKRKPREQETTRMVIS